MLAFVESDDVLELELLVRLFVVRIPSQIHNFRKVITALVRRGVGVLEVVGQDLVFAVLECVLSFT